MANRMWDAVRTLGKGAIVVKGAFRTNGGSSPTTTKGKGFSIVRTSTGLYTGTLTDKFNDFDSLEVGIQLNSPRAYDATLKSLSVSSKSFVIETTQRSDGALADIVSDANNWVHFAFWLKNSSLSS